MRTKLKDWCDQNGGQGALAELCGVSQATVSRWLSGKADPRPKLAREIYRKTGITPSELYQ